jgi:hypothetical protein
MTPLDSLVLARIAGSKATPKPSEVAKSLARFAPLDVTPAAWLVTISGVLERYRGKTVRDTLRPGVKWRQLADKILPALALEVDPNAKTLAHFASKDDWAAAIVARETGLWTGGLPPRLPALCDALAWRAMGLHTKPQRLPAEARAYFLKQEIAGASGPPERIVRTEAARIVGAPRADTRPLCDALVRRWIAGTAPPPPQPATFSDRVRELARRATTGTFGDRKVFIASVWDTFHRDPAWAMTLDDFKATLLVAHRHGELELARADLVSAMDPELVRASETAWDGTTFHFIVREAP